MGLNEDFYLLYKISGISVFVTGLKSLNRDRVLSGFMDIVWQKSPRQSGSPTWFRPIARLSGRSITPNQSLFQNEMAISSRTVDGSAGHVISAGTMACSVMSGGNNSGRRARGVGLLGFSFIPDASHGKWFPCISNVLIHSNAD